MELISYALDFVSFLIQNLKEKTRIKAIILFGSVAREEATKKSDVDIFIDVLEINADKKFENEIKSIKDKFFHSVKFLKYWKLLGITNEINLILGNLKKWKLRDSMLGGSLILYQSYSPRLDDGSNKAILSWGTIKSNSKRVMLNKKLFGYKHYNYEYRGVIDKFGAKKLGSNVILINNENINLFLKLFHNFKIPVQIIRVFEYAK
jgi:predicted nucleotidyltransferase